MAAITVTPANVLPSAGATIRSGATNAAIAAGKSVYKDPDDNLIKLMDANVALASGTETGITTSTAEASGQRVHYSVGDPDFDPGGTTVAGTEYYGGATAGDIVPGADLVAADNLHFLGWGKTGNKLKLAPQVTGIAHP